MISGRFAPREALLLADRIRVDFRRPDRQRALHLPSQICPRHRARIRAPRGPAPLCIARIASAVARAACSACGCAPRDPQPLDDAGLIADLVQMAQPAADIGRREICPINPSTGAFIE